MIDRIFNAVRFISNKELKGNISPEEFDTALWTAVQMRYEEYFFELNKWLNKQNRGLSNHNFADLPEIYREKIRHYLSESDLNYTSLGFNVPKDLRYIDGVFYGNRRVRSVSSSTSLYSILSYPDTAPDLNYPVYLQNGDYLDVYPVELTDGLKMVYLRNPKKPKWTYQMFNNNPLFDNTAPDFQDVDIHDSDEENILKKVLKQVGINLKDEQLANYIASEERADFTNENTI